MGKHKVDIDPAIGNQIDCLLNTSGLPADILNAQLLAPNLVDRERYAVEACEEGLQRFTNLGGGFEDGRMLRRLDADIIFHGNQAL